jgi:hypothetical protein
LPRASTGDDRPSAFRRARSCDSAPRIRGAARSVVGLPHDNRSIAGDAISGSTSFPVMSLCTGRARPAANRRSRPHRVDVEQAALARLGAVVRDWMPWPSNGGSVHLQERRVGIDRKANIGELLGARRRRPSIAARVVPVARASVSGAASWPPSTSAICRCTLQSKPT